MECCIHALTGSFHGKLQKTPESKAEYLREGMGDQMGTFGLSPGHGRKLGHFHNPGYFLAECTCKSPGLGGSQVAGN